MGYYKKNKNNKNKNKKVFYIKKEDKSNSSISDEIKDDIISLDNNCNDSKKLNQFYTINKNTDKLEEIDENDDIMDMFQQNNNNSKSKRRQNKKNRRKLKNKNKMNKKIANKIYNKEKSKYSDFWSNQDEFWDNRKIKLNDNLTVVTFDKEKSINLFSNWLFDQLKEKKQRKFTLDNYEDDNIDLIKTRKYSFEPSLRSILKNKITNI